jgi:hypothetical protein
MVHIIIRNLYEGWYNSNACYFFLETLTSTKIKFIHAKGISFKKLRLFFHKVSFTINTLFLPLWEMLHTSLVKLFAEESELFMCAVFQLIVFCKMASSVVILQEAKEMGVYGCWIGTVGRIKKSKFKVQTSAGKVMASILWDCGGIFLVKFVKRGATCQN